MTDLTILCVTQGHDYARPFILEMERLASDVFAELVLVTDGHEVQSDGYLESVLDDALKLCLTDYVLRLDDDEQATPEMRDWLAAGAYRGHDHWAFPRLNLWPDAAHHITNPPLYPDLQTRLSTKEKSGGRHDVHAGSPHGTGHIAPVAIEHHKFLCRPMEDRLALLERYEAILPGAGKQYAMFSVPELYRDDLATWPVLSPEEADRLIAEHAS
jgi:hypothetical protein